MTGLSSFFTSACRCALLRTFSMLVLLGASTGASAVVFGPGQTLSFDYDMSSSTLGVNEHTLTMELIEGTPTSPGGTYYLSYQVETGNGIIVDSPVFEITGGGNPGPLMAVADLVAGDLSGTVSLSISGSSGLDDVTSATITITDFDGYEVGSQSITELTVETTVPAPATLGLVLIGLLAVSKRQARAMRRRALSLS